MSIAVFFVGFTIAIAIGLTGVGAGILTAPVLMLVFHVPPAAAVGTALTFGAVTKLLTIPVYAARRHIDVRLMLHMLAGGLPGVLVGSTILARVDTVRYQSTIAGVLGATIIVFAVMSLYRFARPAPHVVGRDKPWYLTAVAVPIGAEVGFSSAGSGSLASLALMAFTRLSPSVVVGTDVCFGLGLSLVGGGVLIASGHYDAAILPKLLGGGVLGALVAPNISALIPARTLRIGLLIWIIVLGGNLVIRGLVH